MLRGCYQRSLPTWSGGYVVEPCEEPVAKKTPLAEAHAPRRHTKATAGWKVMDVLSYNSYLGSALRHPYSERFSVKELVITRRPLFQRDLASSLRSLAYFGTFYRGHPPTHYIPCCGPTALARRQAATRTASGTNSLRYFFFLLFLSPFLSLS